MKNQNNTFFSKKTFYSIFIFISLVFITISCSNNDESNLPTATKFNNLKIEALNSITQNFQFSAGLGGENFSFISAKGVIININGSSLTLNGIPVSGLVGLVDLEYIEIFDAGNMLTTGMHTMGLMPDGNRSMLLSGGEFYINATMNGQQLQLDGVIELQIPTNLTDDNGGNPDMTLWNLADNVWEQQVEQISNPQGVFIGGQQVATGSINNYYAFVGNFGWTNVDVFYNNPNPKTTILVAVPEGFSNQNSAVYLHYDEEGNGLANLDTYNSTTKLFSEHYGQIPIGLACHIIFVTESNGQWRYAIKPIMITADAVYNFTLEEITVGSQAQLITAINNLP